MRKIAKKSTKILILLLVMMTSTLFVSCVRYSEKINISYSVGIGGRIEGDVEQSVSYGETAQTVVAIANEGYKFLCWSDGIVQSRRTDSNVKSEINVTAEFERELKTVTYLADSHGRIVGEAVQTVAYGESASKVRAVANEGYFFIGWSDGNESEERVDIDITSDLFISAFFQSVSIDVIYRAGEGGDINGVTNQKIVQGEDSSTVRAVANEGYTFVEWSDGNKSPERNEINVTAPLYFFASFKKINVDLSYTAGQGGKVLGETKQSIIYGESAEAVHAVPDVGYYFVSWSDGNTNPDRIDCYVKSGLNITAEFEMINKTLVYNYNGASSNNSQTDIHLQYKTLQDVSLVVPTKEGYVFEGWYLEWYYLTQISDAEGNLKIDVEIFNRPLNTLYAKWRAEDCPTELPKYKILLVCVTELNATLASDEGVDIEVKYKMTDLERQTCEMLSIMFEAYLNAMMEGIISFEITTYFTKDPVGKENLIRGSSSYPGSTVMHVDYMLNTEELPETKGMLDDYGSVITLYNMNDYDEKLHVGVGSAGAKFATINMELLLDPLYDDGQCEDEKLFRVVLDNTNVEFDGYWESISVGFAHEFIHTVEHSFFREYWTIDEVGLHEIMAYYINSDPWAATNLQLLRWKALFMKRQLFMNGKEMGIPIWFWKKIISQQGK